MAFLEEGVIWLGWTSPHRTCGVPPGTYPPLEASLRQAQVFSLAEGSPELLRLQGSHLTATWDPTTRVLRVVGRHGESLATPPGGFQEEEGDTQVTFLVPTGTVLLGLGAKMGLLNRWGRRWRFWNTDTLPHLPDTDPLYASLPQGVLLYQGKALGVATLWGGETVWDAGHAAQGELRLRAHAGGLQVLVAAGPTVAEVLRRLAQLLGRPCLPPRWALGYQQSHWGYGDQSGFEEVAREFRSRDLPLDALYMDLDYMEDRRPFKWDPVRFPDPEGFLSRLHQQDIHVVAISNAGMPVQDPRFSQLQAAGALVRRDGEVIRGPLWGGETAITDYLHPNAEKVWQSFYRPMIEQGISGIWNDMNEPSFLDSSLSSSPQHPKTLPDDSVHVDAEGREYLHREVHNVFPLYMNRATYHALRELRPNQRPFVLSRSGYLGVGKYAALWTGDNSSWWEHLRATIPTVVGLGLAGVPMAGVDIGGFEGEASPELMARWLALGSFLPLCRNHSSIYSPRQEPYAFGEEVEAVARKVLRWRYALIPTLYSLLYHAHRTGEPILRPLAYAYPNDARCLRCEDEVMVGTHLLLAPVLEPGVDSRRVDLPPGIWYRVDPGFEGRFPGAQSYLAWAPLDTVPIFVRGGGILVVDPQPRDHVAPPSLLELWLFPGGRGEFALFEDDGESFAYESEKGRRVTWLRWQADEDGHGTLWVRREGDYPGAPLLVRLPPQAYPWPEEYTMHIHGQPWPWNEPLPPGELRVKIGPRQLPRSPTPRA